MDNMTLAYILILIGLALLVAEVFVPGGVLAALALAALIVAVTLAFNEGTYTGLTTLVIIFVSLSVFGVLFFYFWPKTPMARSFFLKAPPEEQSHLQSREFQELEQLRGRFGRTISALRPSGITDFDGRRVDTISEGNLIAPGMWVQCIEVKAGKVIVREVAGPPDLENMDTAHFG